MAFIRQQALWHIKKKSKFIAHWSFADRQRIAFRVEGIEQ
jgi:hypothetical protein